MVATQPAPADQFPVEIVKGPEAAVCRVVSPFVRPVPTPPPPHLSLSLSCPYYPIACHRRHCVRHSRSGFWSAGWFGFPSPRTEHLHRTIDRRRSVSNAFYRAPNHRTVSGLHRTSRYKRPRYALSSTTIVITTSPSPTRALRPPLCTLASTTKTTR